MTSANLDLVRSIYADWERGDFFTRSDWVHPEIEFVMTGGPAPGVRTGMNGMVEGWLDFLDAWEWYRTEADEYRELDDGRVLVLCQCRARGKTSGIEVGEVRTDSANLFHVRDGQVVKLFCFWDRDRALAHLGLASQRDAADSR